MSELTDAQVAELKSQHGPELRTVSTADGSGLFVFRRPSEPEWHSFVDALSDESKRASPYSAQKTLAASCCVWPDRSAWAAAVNEAPALAQLASEQIGELAGAHKGITTGKALERLRNFPAVGALKLLALFDGSASDEDRFAGAVLLGGAIDDIHRIRLLLDAVLTKR